MGNLGLPKPKPRGNPYEESYSRGGGEPRRPPVRLTGAMGLENGTVIVIAYVLVSIGVIIGFLLAVFGIAWLVNWLRERR
jgi:Flp pilus assembly protein TadB